MPLQDRPLSPQRDDLHPGSDDDPGAMGINYRCEPMVERWSRPEQSITAVSAPWRKTTGKKPSSPHRGRRPSGSSSCSPTVASACWTKTAISSRPRSRAWNPEKRAATKPRTTRTPGKRATTTAQSGSSTVCKGSPSSTRCSTPTSMATRPRRCFRPYFQLERVRKHRTCAAYLVSFGQ